MGKMLLLVAVLAGCDMYFGGGNSNDSAPDAAVIAPPDSETCPTGRILPPCGQIAAGCGDGTIEIDCPHADGHQADDEVCFCPGVAIGAPHGWCIASQH